MKDFQTNRHQQGHRYGEVLTIFWTLQARSRFVWKHFFISDACLYCGLCLCGFQRHCNPGDGV